MATDRRFTTRLVINILSMRDTWYSIVFNILARDLRILSLLDMYLYLEESWLFFSLEYIQGRKRQKKTLIYVLYIYAEICV